MRDSLAIRKRLSNGYCRRIGRRRILCTYSGGTGGETGAYAVQIR